jgi:hypothetical protein
MKLFKMKEDWTLHIEEEVWSLLPFKKILKKDKSRSKELALKEMSFIYFYTDIKSDYLIITNDKIREEEIKKDIGLPEDWKIDTTIREAIDFYESRSTTTISKLYKDALKAANDVSEYLRSTDVLLAERDDRGKPVTAVNTITSAINQVNKLMKDLKAAEKEVLKEQQEMEGRMKGSKQLSVFEEGLNFEQ